MEIRTRNGERDRRIRLPGTVNLRDVGGYPVTGRGGAGGEGSAGGRGAAGGGGAAGAGTGRWGTLLRGDALHRLDESGRATLSALGLRTVIDLRTDDEVRAAPSALDEAGVRTYHVPVFVASAIGRLCGDGALPGLVHCTAGKDRTGLVVALVLEVIGVPDEVIAADYALSDAYLDASTARAISRIRAVSGVGRWLDLGALGASPQVIHDALARIRSRSGSVSDYLIGNGLTARDLGNLRTALVA